MSLVAIGVSTTTGRRPEIRGKLIAGAATQLLGCALLLTLGNQSAIWLLLLIALVFGIPQGLNSLANQNAVYHQADAAHLGSSSGLLRTFNYLGAMIASAANGAFFGRTADTSGIHHIGAFLIVIAALFLALAVADRSLARVGRTRPDAETVPAAGQAATPAK